ncbi:MAG: hypothetical protein ACREMO_11440 [Gemmatimonadales bacterium]
MRRAPLSDASREYRTIMWLVGLLGLAALLVAVGGVRGWVPRLVGLFAGFAFFGCLIGVSLTGLKAHRQALADRDMEGRRAMIVMLAARLGQQDDTTLTRIAGGDGIAAEAAALILKGRKEKVSGER